MVTILTTGMDGGVLASEAVGLPITSLGIECDGFIPDFSSNVEIANENVFIQPI